MQKYILVLMTSVSILTCGAIPASAQQTPGGPGMQQRPDQPPAAQQRPEREGRWEDRRGQRRDADDDDDWDDDDRYDRRTMGYGPRWRNDQGWGRGRGGTDRGMGPGMMGPGMMGAGGMRSGSMGRMLFALMDADGDGTVSLEEFKAAHERIFKSMDADKDGRLTLEEMRTFMQGAGRPAPRQ
jgi:EF hand